MNKKTDGASLYFEQNMQECEITRIGRGVAAVYSSRAPEKEGANEDSAGVIAFDEDSGICIVADGAGGQRGGAQASALAVRSLVAALEEGKSAQSELRDAILNGFEIANHEVYGLGTGAATTLAVVEIQSGTVRPYHVGDSMVLVVGQRGKIKLQTISHSPVGYGIEAGFLDAAEAMHHEDRHLVFNMVGSTDMRIEIGSAITLAPRDTMLLASDGLFDNLHVHEIVECVRKGPLPRAVRALADECHYRMEHPDGGHPSKPDDLTFIAMRLGEG